MLKAIIIDDESKAREGLANIIKFNFPQINIVAEASNVPEGVKQIQKTQPDVVFLDIEMPIYSGLELLDFFEKDKVTFNIIFTTAYADHAIKAFRLSAIDYLLKPIQVSQLKEAIDKINIRPIKAENYNLLKANYFNTKQQKIAISLSEGLTIIDLNDIIFLKAEGAYTQITLSNHSKIIASKILGDFDYLCEENHFFRTHRSFIINTEKIKRISRQTNDVIMCNDDEISITPERKSTLIDLFKDIKL